ncbi:MAG: hypothetical protein ACHQ1D_01215 [Nitrososphaerales archaeon]
MKSFHIAAYVFQADIVCCDCIAEWAKNELMKEGYAEETVEEIAMYHGVGYDAGVFGHRSETLLHYIASHRGLNLEDDYSYDSDDFPKVVFADQVEGKEYCGTCHEVIP